VDHERQYLIIVNLNKHTETRGSDGYQHEVPQSTHSPLAIAGKLHHGLSLTDQGIRVNATASTFSDGVSAQCKSERDSVLH